MEGPSPILPVSASTRRTDELLLWAVLDRRNGPARIARGPGVAVDTGSSTGRKPDMSIATRDAGSLHPAPHPRSLDHGAAELPAKRSRLPAGDVNRT